MKKTRTLNRQRDAKLKEEQEGLFIAAQKKLSDEQVSDCVSITGRKADCATPC